MVNEMIKCDNEMMMIMNNESDSNEMMIINDLINDIDISNDDSRNEANDDQWYYY